MAMHYVKPKKSLKIYNPMQLSLLVLKTNPKAYCTSTRG
jgi:hypothetical protein